MEEEDTLQNQAPSTACMGHVELKARLLVVGFGMDERSYLFLSPSTKLTLTPTVFRTRHRTTHVDAEGVPAYLVLYRMLSLPVSLNCPNPTLCQHRRIAPSASGHIVKIHLVIQKPRDGAYNIVAIHLKPLSVQAVAGGIPGTRGMLPRNYSGSHLWLRSWCSRRRLPPHQP
eukprot:337548-Rhodomonas_salina.2